MEMRGGGWVIMAIRGQAIVSAGSAHHVLVLVGNGKAQRHVKEALLGLERIEKLQQGAPVVPAADVGRDLVFEVCAGEPRDGHEVYVCLCVEACLLQEGLELPFNLLITLLVPLAIREADLGWGAIIRNPPLRICRPQVCIPLVCLGGGFRAEKKSCQKEVFWVIPKDRPSY